MSAGSRQRQRPGPRPAPLVTVSGFCSGVGKTSLVEFLIRRLAPVAALKVTVVDSGAAGCPIDRACGVCEALSAPYRIITERRRIEVPRKDTGRYAAAGAFPVVWVQTQAAHLDEALGAGLSAATAATAAAAATATTPPRGLVAEGNTAVRLLAPDLAIMVDRPDRAETKPSAAALLDRIDLAVLNRPAWSPAAAVAATHARLERELPRRSIFELDLRAPGPAGERFLVAVTRHLAAARPAMVQLEGDRAESPGGRR